jgi:hypothetical protein
MSHSETLAEIIDMRRKSNRQTSTLGFRTSGKIAQDNRSTERVAGACAR